jgi:hypothetical protein
MCDTLALDDFKCLRGMRSRAKTYVIVYRGGNQSSINDKTVANVGSGAIVPVQMVAQGSRRRCKEAIVLGSVAYGQV